jgi:ribosomal protein L18E
VSSSATVSVTVAAPVSGIPVALNDNYFTLQERAVVTGSVLANDTLADNAVISAFDVNTPNGGSVVNNGDGTFTYYPPPSLPDPFLGDDTFTYTLTDDTSDSDTATVTVTVLAQGVVPFAAADSNSTATDVSVTTGNVLNNDLLGDKTAIASLAYSLNGAPDVPLSIGPEPSNPERLVAQGDFNVDIATSSLTEGANSVDIKVEDRNGNQTVQRVTFQYTSSTVWPLPYAIDWASVANIQDVTQVVDGRWLLEADSVRPAQVGYDRVLDIGDLSRDNYEVEVPVTVYGVDPRCINNVDDCRGSPALHIVARWPGHYDDGPQQPEIGFRPIGGAGSYKWTRSALNVGVRPRCVQENWWCGEESGKRSKKIRVETCRLVFRISLSCGLKRLPARASYTGSSCGRKGRPSPPSGI